MAEEEDGGEEDVLEGGRGSRAEEADAVEGRGGGTPPGQQRDREEGEEGAEEERQLEAGQLRLGGAGKEAEPVEEVGGGQLEGGQQGGEEQGGGGERGELGGGREWGVPPPPQDLKKMETAERKYFQNSECAATNKS